MKKKAIKYTIIFLVVPLILSLSIAIATGNRGFNKNNTGYDGINVQTDKTDTTKNNTTIDEIKKSNTYIYITLFTFMAASGGVLIYIKQKRGI